MKGLETQVTLARTTYFVGESLPMRVRLTNRGTQPVAVPNRRNPSEFEFIFRAGPGGRVVKVYSAGAALTRRSMERVPLVRSRPDSLPPGETVEYAVNPALFFVEPPPPGAYVLSVAFGEAVNRVESPGAALQVVAPQPLVYTTLVQPERQAAGIALVTKATPERKSTLLFYQSADERPLDGLFYPLVEGGERPVEGVAIALEDSPAIGEMWVAWLQGERLKAGRIESDLIENSAEMGDLPLRPVLYPVGWSPESVSARFALVGTRPQGGLALALVTFSTKSSPEIRSFALGADDLPAHWRLSYCDGPDGARVQWVGAVGDNVRTRLVGQEISLATGSVSAPVVLKEFEGELLALVTDPRPKGAGVVDALWREATGDRVMKLTRVSLEGARESRDWNLPEPEPPPGPAYHGWALPARTLEPPAVLVRAGDRVRVHFVGREANWTTLIDQAAGADFLRLEPVGKSLWAFWVDPAAGPRMKVIRQPVP